MIETIKKNSHTIESKVELKKIIDILENNDKDDPMTDTDYVQKSWPLIKEYSGIERELYLLFTSRYVIFF